MNLCGQCKKYGKCGKPYTSMSNYAEKCKDFEDIETFDKKPTDSEIVKALENWIKNYEGTYGNFRTLGLALDLINRQKAENERLEAENTILSQNADTAFQDGLNEAQDLYAKQIKNEIKAEAYQEFVNKIKIHAYYIDFPKEHRVVDEDDIDNSLKELAGDSNAKEKQ